MNSENGDQQNDQNEKPALSLETFHDLDNIASYSYHPSWRPPTPPPPHSNRNDDENDRRSQSSSKSSWLHSILPSSHKKSTSSSSPLRSRSRGGVRGVKFPPGKAFQSPTLMSANSEDSMVDGSLLLQDESEIHQVDTTCTSTETAADVSTTSASSTCGSGEQEKKKKGRDDDQNIYNYKILDDKTQFQSHQNKRYNSTSKYKKRSKRNTNTTSQKNRNQLGDFFYKGIEELESQHKSQSQYSLKSTLSSSHINTNENGYGGNEYFVTPASRRLFLEELVLLNSQDSQGDHDNAEDQFDDDPDNIDQDHDDGLDFTTLFTMFGCSPTSREKELSKRGLTLDHEGLPAISDIRKSSLSYISNGRIQIRLPKDRVRLLMDDYMEAGVLCVEKEVITQQPEHAVKTTADDEQKITLEANNSEEKMTSPLLQPKSYDDQQKEGMNQNFALSGGADNNHDKKVINNNEISQANLPELQYVLTIDQDLYRRVLSEMADSKAPCGLYYCCHAFDSKNVNIKVAIGILMFVFSLLLWGTLVWPTS